jgi:hypothetical protein
MSWSVNLRADRYNVPMTPTTFSFRLSGTPKYDLIPWAATQGMEFQTASSRTFSAQDGAPVL